MPVVARFRRCRIEMYFGDHNPPHFHVITIDDHRVGVAIADGSIICGSARARDIAEALSWAAEHRAELLRRWSRYTEAE